MSQTFKTLMVFVAVGLSMPAYGDVFKDFNLVNIYVVNHSSKTIYANGSGATWDWVEYGPVWNQTPIAPRGQVSGPLKWKLVSGVPRSGQAGYAISLVNTGKPPNIANFTINNQPTGWPNPPLLGKPVCPADQMPVKSTSIVCVKITRDTPLTGDVGMSTEEGGKLFIHYYDK